MKLKEIQNPYESRKVIMYNADHTKALYHNKKLAHVTDSIYMGEAQTDGYSTYCDIYVCWPESDVGLWLFTTNPEWRDVDELVQDVIRGGADTMEHFIRRMERLVAIHEHIRFTDLEMMTRIKPEMEASLWESRRIYAENRRRKETEKEAQREAEDAAFVSEQNAIAEKAIKQALETIRHGGVLRNEKITLYRDRYDHSQYSAVNHLMRQYGIEVPLRTQGWINDLLSSVTIKDGVCETYRYFRTKRGKGSEVFFDYMSRLIKAVRAEEGETRTIENTGRYDDDEDEGN